MINVQGNSRQTVLKQQYNLLMIVTVCCISHILKALQQVPVPSSYLRKWTPWKQTQIQFSVLIISYYQLDPQIYLSIIWPTVNIMYKSGAGVKVSHCSMYWPTGWPHILQQSFYCFDRPKFVPFFWDGFDPFIFLHLLLLPPSHFRELHEFPSRCVNKFCFKQSTVNSKLAIHKHQRNRLHLLHF